METLVKIEHLEPKKVLKKNVLGPLNVCTLIPISIELRD